MSWKSLSLGDALSVKHGFAFKSTYFSDRGPFLVLTPGNFHEHGGFRLRTGKDRWYTGHFPEEYILSETDIIVAMTEQGPGLLGSSAIVPEGNRYLHNQRLGLVTRLDESVLDRKFTYYLFNTKSVRGQISSSASGTKVRHTSPDRIYRVRVRVPGVESQARIADILSAYDDLIENNRRRIALLEQAARELYREWFVRLRFPGYENTRIVDGLPEGWERRTIADVCTSFDDGDWIETKDQGGEDFRLLQISNIGNNEFVETGNYRWITSETFRSLRCNEVLPGDILISRMPKPIGRAWLVYEQPWRMITAVDVTIARPDQTAVDPLYYLYHLNSQTHIARCELRATGATRPRISRKTMGALPIFRPPMTLQLTFGQITSAKNEQRNILTGQNKVIARARDLLLPRLMSGEVGV